MTDAELTTRELAALACTTDLMEREWAPCRHACPVHADVRTYLQALAEGRYRDSIDVIRRNLAMASVCGRICHHPCEANCRRREVDDAVAIRELKRFVAETQGAAGSTVLKPPRQDQAAIAIVGGGPAGLAAALELARLGYKPTIFEKDPIAGGIPATAVPRYRMPIDVLQMDVDWIAAHGVTIRTGSPIGKDRTIDSLLAEGFAAVLIATGLARSRGLPMPGSDHPRVIPVLEFLRATNFDHPLDIGANVLVIGGGNVAVDAARTAVRRGANVRMMCLEDEEEMPAWDWEQHEAREEGVEILYRRGPTQVVVTDGKVAGIKARKVTRVFDEDRRFDPRYDDSDVIDVPCDTVILAIGQQADLGFVEGSKLATDRGRLTVDRATQQTSIPNVFAAGEIATPPGSVVEACASGKRAAMAMDLFLSGKPIELDDTLPPALDKIADPTAEKVLKVPRNPVLADSAERRKHTNVPFDHTYAEAVALAEARRCMSCGAGAAVLADKCAACQTCVRVCPFDIPRVEKTAIIESTLCQACGICIAECPAGAIVPRGHAPDALMKRTDAALAGKAAPVAYVAGFHLSAEQWRGEQPTVPGAKEIVVTSPAQVSVRDLLHAFEAGAESVTVVACPDGSDRYPQASQRIRARVEQARQLLAEVGIDAERLTYQEQS